MAASWLISPGLVLEVDDATCIVLRATVGDSEVVHTITDVDRFKAYLDEARVASVVARDVAGRRG